MFCAVKTYFTYFIVALVMLQVLNLGLYAQDFENIAKDKDGNEPNIINSVTEYIAEVVMHKENAFPEKKESPNQSNSHDNLIKFQPFKIAINNCFDKLNLLAKAENKYNSFVLSIYTNFSPDIVAPPPKWFV